MKRIASCFLICLILLPLLTLRPQAAQDYRTFIDRDLKALDEEYIRRTEGNFVEVGDSVIEGEDDVPSSGTPQTPGGNTGAGDEMTSEEVLSLAPNYFIMYHMNSAEKTLRIFCDRSEGAAPEGQAMLSYAKASWIPWIRFQEIRRNIEVARIEEGVKSLGHYVFYHCTNLKEVYLPHSLEKVDSLAFYMSENLETIYYAGTREDFNRNVLWNTTGNTIDKAKLVNALEKIHFGEHVQVECRTQDGRLFDSYTVGGFRVGDKYEIAPKSYDGMTVQNGKVQVGKFKRDDQTVYTFTYTCAHEYEISDPTKPCGSYCRFCGEANPDGLEHTYYKTVFSTRGFRNDGSVAYTCTVCEHTVFEKKLAYSWYFLIGGAGLLVAAGVAFGTTYFVRKRKKLKELTW